MAAPKKPTGPEEKIRAIYFAVGVAMTQWQGIEQALTQLFVLLVNAQSGRAASAAFASVLSFRTKLAMVNYAAQVSLEGTDLLSEWNTLNNRLDRKVGKRNEIAHFMLYQKAIVTQAGQPQPSVAELNEQIDWYLQPTAFDGAFMNRRKGNPPQLKANDIMNRANAFIKANKDIWEFSEKVRAHVAPPPASPAR
jgi:hypothetical protein